MYFAYVSGWKHVCLLRGQPEPSQHETTGIHNKGSVWILPSRCTAGKINFEHVTMFLKYISEGSKQPMKSTHAKNE